MNLSASLKRLTVLASFLTAFLVLSAFRPTGAFAGSACALPTVTLSPASAKNPIGISHTVTAQVTGSCTSNDSSSSCTSDSACAGTCVSGFCSNISLNACSTDADCASPCDFSCVQGAPIGFVVTGVNPQDDNFAGTVQADGTASFQYSGTNEGTDTIQACLDLFADEPAEEGVADCITSAGGGDDVASNQVTKTWIAAISGTITLSPLAAVNPDNPAPKNHTVTATVSGIQTCSTSHQVCVDDSDCTGGGDTCTDPSNVTVGFVIVSGPNKGDKGWGTTDAGGNATLTYTSNGVAGVDTIKACIDGDPVSPGVPDENPGCSDNGAACTTDANCNTGAKCIAAPVINCINDAASSSPIEPDFASDPATKRWDPTLALQNLDAGATLANLGTPVYTSNPAYNPVGSTHTVQATITGAQKICFSAGAGTGSRTACTTNTDCTGTDTCGIAGYPVFFGVLPGSQNAGDLGSYVNTDANGVASKTYPDSNGSGIDTIQACVDADVSEGIPDDTTFTGCLSDYAGGATTGQADVPSNTVLKTWLTTFVTGGGKVITGSKTWDSFGGVVGYKPGSKSALTGEWTQQVHQAKGGNINCHWNAFTAFALSCSTGSCGANPDTVVFTTANVAGACKGLAGAQGESVKIVATGTKPAKISVFNATSGALNVGAPTALVPGSGNFVIHP